MPTAAARGISSPGSIRGRRPRTDPSRGRAYPHRRAEVGAPAVTGIPGQGAGRPLRVGTILRQAPPPPFLPPRGPRWGDHRPRAEPCGRSRSTSASSLTPAGSGPLTRCSLREPATIGSPTTSRPPRARSSMLSSRPSGTSPRLTARSSSPPSAAPPADPLRRAAYAHRDANSTSTCMDARRIRVDDKRGIGSTRDFVNASAPREPQRLCELLHRRRRRSPPCRLWPELRPSSLGEGEARAGTLFRMNPTAERTTTARPPGVSSDARSIRGGTRAGPVSKGSDSTYTRSLLGPRSGPRWTRFGRP